MSKQKSQVKHAVLGAVLLVIVASAGAVSAQSPGEGDFGVGGGGRHEAFPGPDLGGGGEEGPSIDFGMIPPKLRKIVEQMGQACPLLGDNPFCDELYVHLDTLEAANDAVEDAEEAFEEARESGDRAAAKAAKKDLRAAKKELKKVERTVGKDLRRLSKEIRQAGTQVMKEEMEGGRKMMETQMEEGRKMREQGEKFRREMESSGGQGGPGGEHGYPDPGAIPVESTPETTPVQ